MNLRKIILGQLIALWFFGVVLFLIVITFAEYDDAPGLALIGFLILMGLAVHTFILWQGWKRGQLRLE
jgi:hypothetical protein